MPLSVRSLLRPVFAIGLVAAGVLGGCAAPAGDDDTASDEAAQTASAPKRCKPYLISVRSGTTAVTIAQACTSDNERHMRLELDKAGARFSFDSLDHAEDKARLDARIEAMVEGGVPRATLALLSDLVAQPSAGEDPQLIFRDHLLALP